MTQWGWWLNKSMCILPFGCLFSFAHSFLMSLNQIFVFVLFFFLFTRFWCRLARSVCSRTNGYDWFNYTPSHFVLHIIDFDGHFSRCITRNRQLSGNYLFDRKKHYQSAIKRFFLFCFSFFNKKKQNIKL